MVEQLIPTLEKSFRCQIFGVKARRNVTFVRTNRGMWVVKGYRERAKAEWVTQLAQVLREKGFYHSVQYLSNIVGEAVLPLGDHYYTVMKAIDGREANNANLQDVKRSAAALARFHLAAQGFPVPLEVSWPKPTILDKWEGRLAQFEQIVENIKKRQNPGRMEQIVLSVAKEARRDAAQVLDQIYKIPLFSECDQSIAAGTLAHRDVASHNFLIAPSGSCYLIDLDTVDFDMQLVDVVQLMSRMLLLQEYRFDSFMGAIEAYDKIKPLSDTQIWMIFQMLRYPDNILREVTGVYQQRPGYSPRGVMDLLQLERRYRHERRAFLQSEQRIFQRIGPYHFVG